MTPAPVGRPAWHDAAACRGWPTRLFFTNGDGPEVASAKACCRVCPVCAECLDYALDADEITGVYGGLTRKERNRLRYSSPSALIHRYGTLGDTRGDR